MCTRMHPVSHLRSHSSMMFAASLVSFVAITLSPSTCLNLPEVKPAAVATTYPNQVGVNTADTQDWSTSQTQVPTPQKGIKVFSKLQSSSKPEQPGATTVVEKRLVDEAAEAAGPYSPQSYTETDQATLTQPSSRQADERSVNLVTPMPPKTTERSAPTTDPQRGMEPTDDAPHPPAAQVWPPSEVCPPTSKLSHNATKGAIVCRLEYMNCSPQEYSWTFIIPEGYGFAVEFHSVQVREQDSLSILNFGQVPWRTFTQTRWETWAPLLLPEPFIRIVFDTPNGWSLTNFNISYTTHSIGSLPSLKYVAEKYTLTESYLTYDCTGITDLPRAIACDGIRHCEHGEDEKNCPYRDQGCGDWFPYKDHCLRAVFGYFIEEIFEHAQVTMPTHGTMPLQAEQSCQSEYGATLALLPDSAGMDIVTQMVHKGGFLSAVVGIHKVKPVSRRSRHLYRFLWQWGDRGSLIAYEQERLQRAGTMADCAILNVSTSFLEPLRCALPEPAPQGYVCMRPNPNHSAETFKLKLSGVSFPRASASPDVFPTKECPDGSVVQAFHRCQWGEQDEDSDTGWSANNLPLFQCRFGPAIHYSLLCDGNDDCADRSDELGCQKPYFSPLLNSSFVCRSRQAIPADRRCDGVTDCFDESDEESCISCGSFYVMCPGAGCVSKTLIDYFDICPYRTPTHGLGLYPWKPWKLRNVKLDGYGMSFLEDVSSQCDEISFACRDGYCIPTFLLNNGEQDCPYGEDEDIPVHNMTCPGYYRCQGTGSCVHKNYLCDGVYHCPNKDDEMFCHITCPHDQGCVCEGQAYKCSQMIDPRQHLHVRYLDLSHASNVYLDNIHVMEYLSFLNLSFCRLGNVTLMNLHQLRILDLTFNSLTELASLNLHQLSELIYLDLSNNPLVKTLDSAFSTMLKLGELQKLRTLVMTNVSLETIGEKVFSPLSSLTYLDIRANPVHTYGQESLWGLTALEELHTDESKLCCAYFHPSLSQCHAPVDELSSCNDLLGQDFFRVFLWAFSVLAIVGNVGVLIYRLFVNTHTSHTTFRILVKNLCASDLLMGVYMMVIGVADAQYRGVYVAKEREWTHSPACTAAGFLSLVSSEVSAFVICLITLDRVLVLCFPLNPRFHLSSRVTISACCVIWVIGMALAAVPLLAGMEFYGQNGICLPLPITRRQYSGQTYAFGVFIVLNFVIFLFIGFGQVLIYRAVRSARKAAGSNRGEQEMAIARRLFLVVLTDFCCWFPIGLMGLLASIGTPIPGEVNVWAAIFILPLNSALNPFLYTLNGLMEEWEKRRMEMRTRRMIGKLKTEIPKWQPARVQELTRICIHSKLVEKEVVMRWLGVNVDSTASTASADVPRAGGDAV